MSWVRAGAAGEWHKVRERAGEYITCACDITVLLDENAQMVDEMPNPRTTCSNDSNEEGRRGQGCGGQSGIEDVPDAEPAPLIAGVAAAIPDKTYIPVTLIRRELPRGAKCSRKNCGKRARTWHLAKPETYYCAGCAEIVCELAESAVTAPLQQDPVEQLTAALGDEGLREITITVRGLVVASVDDNGGCFQIDLGGGRDIIVFASEVVAVEDQP